MCKEKARVTVHGYEFSELKIPYNTVVVDFADLECEASAKSVTVCARREPVTSQEIGITDKE